MAAFPVKKLSELTALVQQAIHHVFDDLECWVLAEVTNYSFYAQKNHHYFDLVEKSKNGSDIIARMQAAAWYSGNESIRKFERATGQKFKNDIQVLVKVSVDYHAVYGLKLTLLDIDINYTIGALEQQKQETIQALIDEGFLTRSGDEYSTNNKQLALPAVIQKIAVISSAESAGLQDFVHTLENNSFDYRFSIDYYHTVVQGESRAELLYNKFIEIFTSAIPYDAVIVVRGGGSQTDFLLFDQLILGKVVARFPIPVITGIGHQKNETIVDLVAKISTKTPTRAAEFIIAHNRAFEERTIQIEKAVIIKTQQLLAKYKEGIAECRFVLGAQPGAIIRGKSNDLKNISSNLKNFSTHHIKNQYANLDHLQSLFKIISPQNILRKGFALVMMDGQIIADAGRVDAGKQLSVILSGQEIRATVDSKNQYHGQEFDL